MLRQAMASGVRKYLIKPFTPEDMVAAVRRVGAQAAEARQKAEAARATEVEREKYLIQLTLAYLKLGRMDDDASKVYAVMISRPQVDPNLLIRLAEVFLARRDWRLLRMICERMEKMPPNK